MSDGFKWYFTGLAIGLVIGLPASSELVTRMDSDLRDAARTGTVTAEQHCTALLSLQDKLNEKYERRANDDVTASRHTLTMDQCVAGLSAPRP